MRQGTPSLEPPPPSLSARHFFGLFKCSVIQISARVFNPLFLFLNTTGSPPSTEEFHHSKKYLALSFASGAVVLDLSAALLSATLEKLFGFTPRPNPQKQIPQGLF